jgi:flagellin
MAAVINTNMASLQAQNQLSRTTASLNNTIQQLSSGLRVNSAADDASGYSIAKNMDSVINGSTVSIRNANDAISFSQRATGALESLSNILGRMRELSTQAANDANGITNTTLLQTEFASLKAELTRNVASTTFNGVSLFAANTRSFQVGSGTTANDRIDFTTTALSNVTTLATGSTYIINGGSGIKPGLAIVRAFEDAAAAGATKEGVVLAAAEAASNDQSLTEAQKVTVIAEINGAIGASVAATLTALRLEIGTMSADRLTFTVSTDAGKSTSSVALDTAGTNAATNARAATDQIDLAITAVNTEASNHGAFQNKLGFVASNLSSLIETTSAAKSRIVDTDFAAQTAQLSKYQILQQAGTAMLAQANQMGSNVLTLLK